MGKIVLVTGGSRSGKSRFAEKYIAGLAAAGTKIGYIATSEIIDEEMEFRVKLHRARRPADWTTYEAPYDADAAIGRAAADGCRALLFDCVTVYVNNLLYRLGDLDDFDKAYAIAEEKIAAVVKAVKAAEITAVFVTNEVGSGIVPDNMLSRQYRDIAGLSNQWLAAAADEVYLVVCGLAVDIRKLAANTTSF